MPYILIIEDERVIRSALGRFLERNGFQVAEADSVPNAERSFDLHSFDLIISDLRLPGPPGTEVIQRCDGVPVLIMTSYAGVRSAVDAMRQGAVDYIPKPFNHNEFLSTVQHVLKKHRQQQQIQALQTPLSDKPPAGIVGECAGMRRIFKHIHKIAPTDSTVLILGESGTGKELVARALHEQSKRSGMPLIAVNCTAIPEGLIESELFGHERTIANNTDHSRWGLMEAANGGTLFLDEIGELPLAAQARLLRLLQGGEIRRVGSAQTSRIDIRLIAATHQDLQQRVSLGLFRGDLYYRLRVMEIDLPPLRERGEDMALLARFLLDKTCKRIGRPPLSLTDDALVHIQAYDWPGNVRELENTLERAAILSEEEIITAAALNLATSGSKNHQTSLPLPQSYAKASVSVDMSLDDYFRHFVLSNQTHITETEMARRLGISRKSLWEKRQRLGIPKPKKQHSIAEPIKFE
ncbi:MAG: sigma-54-dependent Fis family transcriptional regulator [Candidatus Competibacteraceae bacterium]|nr:sigma-54-dependent Fis family transcriptional regulator [Candidatus Competibacteraceae bacterium]